MVDRGVCVPSIPKRRDELIDARASRVGAASVGVARPVRKPSARKEWHDSVKRLWRSFASSGQVEFWQESDWAFARMLCDDLSRFQKQEDAAMRSRAERDEWDAQYGWMDEDELREAALEAGDRSIAKPPRVKSFGSAAKMEILYSALQRLLVTETDRRRARIELQVSQEGVESPVDEVMESYAESLRAV